RNVLTLLTGTKIAQAIPIAISPILTRLYTPEDFGALAIFIAITAILGSIANGRYELAIVLPKSNKEALSIMLFSLIISTVLSAILMLIIIAFHSNIVELLNAENIAMWLYFIPMVVFFSGLYNSLNYYNTRKKKFSVIAKTSITRSTGLAIVQITIGIFKKGSSGLILGQMV